MSESESTEPTPDRTVRTHLHRIAVEMGAMAQNGLYYATDKYDIDRYRRLRTMTAEILDLSSSTDSAETFAAALAAEAGHATPKVDVRGALFDADDRVLLIREARDGRWALPGGWADAMDAPSEAICREVEEEAGLGVVVTKLAAVHDGSRHNGHAGSPWHIYKHFFLLEVDPPGAEPTAGLDGETTDVAYFRLDRLPELSTGRTTAAQLELLAAHHKDPLRSTDFD